MHLIKFPATVIDIAGFEHVHAFALSALSVALAHVY